MNAQSLLSLFLLLQVVTKNHAYVIGAGRSQRSAHKNVILTNCSHYFRSLQVRPLGDPITSATIAVYRAVSRELLPTPSKSHYLFNTRDMAKIISGMMQVGHRATHVISPSEL